MIVSRTCSWRTLLNTDTARGKCSVSLYLQAGADVAHASLRQAYDAAYAVYLTCAVGRRKGGVALNIGWCFP